MRHWPRLLFALATTFGLVGCAETAESARGLLVSPWTKKQQAVVNVKTPAERIEELRKLAGAASNSSPQTQQRVSEELAREIQYENDAAVRRQILRTLAEYPTPMASAVLTAGLGDPDALTRIVACQSLGRKQTPEAVAELSRALNSDTNLDVRIAAVRALGESRQSAAVAPLAEVLNDPDPALQFRAIESLANATGRDYGDNVEAWQEYARTGQTDAAEVSIAELIGRYFR